MDVHIESVDSGAWWAELTLPSDLFGWFMLALTIALIVAVAGSVVSAMRITSKRDETEEAWPGWIAIREAFDEDQTVPPLTSES